MARRLTGDKPLTESIMVWFTGAYASFGLDLDELILKRDRAKSLNSGLILIPAWISNHMPRKVWAEIIYPFLNFNGHTVEVWEWVSNFSPHFIIDVITHPCWE